VVSVVDDTVTKEAERALAALNDELRRSNEELANFASTASHDLFQPLQKIYGFAQLLQEDPDLEKAQAQDYLGRIVVGCEQMRTFIQDLLAFSRLTSEARPFESVELAAVVREVAELFERETAAGARIEVDPLPTVLADRTQMSQLFQNLIGNALTYVANGVVPTVHVHSARGDGEWQVSVVDNGIGVRPEDRQRAFVMFQRLVGDDEYPGTGIGLALCAKVVERHGGRIWIEDNPGGGSSICFTLPDRPPR
jgi:light-regulated signal transduction histidine kinase (bacteriophytochrome)